jgi:hypothetical protein
VAPGQVSYADLFYLAILAAWAGSELWKWWRKRRGGEPDWTEAGP